MGSKQGAVGLGCMRWVWPCGWSHQRCNNPAQLVASLGSRAPSVTTCHLPCAAHVTHEVWDCDHGIGVWLVFDQTPASNVMFGLEWRQEWGLGTLSGTLSPGGVSARTHGSTTMPVSKHRAPSGGACRLVWKVHGTYTEVCTSEAWMYTSKLHSLTLVQQLFAATEHL